MFQHRSWNALLLVFFTLLACSAPDPKFGSPEATIATLFAVYGAQHMSEAEARARLANREHFQLSDPATYRQCFFDWLGPQDEGLAGYVFGSLIAAKDNLSFRRQGADVVVQTKHTSGREITLAVLTPDAHKWKVVLRKSVPEDIRERLYNVYNDARKVSP